MTTHTEMETRWDDSDRHHLEKELPAVDVRQGHLGRRILTVLIAAFVLAFIVWIPVEIWGSYQAEEQSPSAVIQTPLPASTPKSSP